VASCGFPMAWNCHQNVAINPNFGSKPSRRHNNRVMTDIFSLCRIFLFMCYVLRLCLAFAFVVLLEAVVNAHVHAWTSTCTCWARYFYFTLAYVSCNFCAHYHQCFIHCVLMCIIWFLILIIFLWVWLVVSYVRYSLFMIYCLLFITHYYWLLFFTV